MGKGPYNDSHPDNLGNTALLHNGREINKSKSQRSSMANKSFTHPVELGGKVGVFGAMLTIVGTIIGGGIVGIPFATLQTGIWLVLVVHALNVMWGIYSVHLLLEAKNISGLASFSELGFYWFGRSSIFIINGLIVLAQVGMPIVYFMIIGDIGNGLLGKIHKIKETWWSGKQFPILVVAILLFYFAIKKEIQELKSAGFVLLSGVILFIIAMIVLLIMKGTENFSFGEISKPKFNVEMLANVPTIFLAYGFQSAFFPAYSSLKNKTDANGMKATVASFSFCAIVYILASIVALLKFGTELEGNVLNNVSHTPGWLPIIIDIVFLCIAMMHIPIVLFVGKEAFLIIIDEIMRKSYSTAPRVTIDEAYNLRDSLLKARNGEESEGKAYLTMNPLIFYGVSVFLYWAIVTAACLLNDITLVFGIIGSVAGSYLIFIAPSSFYLRSIQIEEEDVPFFKKLAAWVYMILGFIIMIGCLFATIYTAVKGD
jgi:amino acid permease